MLGNSFIRSITAGFFLALLAFSATPKIALHQVLSNHKDTQLRSRDANTCQLNIAGFSCKFDNLVVDTPFFYKVNLITFLVPSSFILKSATADYGISSTVHYISRLRGPPSFI